MRAVTPRGFRDVLPEEAAEREVLRSCALATMRSWGYAQIETPVVEVLATLEAAAGPLDDIAFRLFDSDGRLLALRPEMTVPAARLAATRLDVSEAPQRLCYAAEVFREHESLRGQARQFTQLGVELLGEGGAAADAEVVSVLVECLDALGMPSFTIGMGTVAVLHGVLEASAGDDAWKARVLQAAHDRNLVELDRLSRDTGIASAVGEALRELPRIRGGADAIERCRVHARACGCDGVLDDLAESWGLLEASGASSRVVVDFGIMRKFDYYTGLILEAYAPGLGLPLGGGGRYDGVLGTFGTPAPAAGFALGLERIAIALVEQGAAPAGRAIDAVVGGDAADAFSAAARLRAAGWRVVLAPGASGPQIVTRAGRAGAFEAFLARGEELRRLDRAGEVADAVTGTPAPPASRTDSSRPGGPAPVREGEG